LAGIASLFLTGAADPQVTSGTTTPFTTATVHFEQNATDGDVEVVFEVKGGAEGLAKLTVAAPNGRNVVDFTARDPATLGMRQFRFESPEPRDAASLKAAYPEGEYVFSGTTVSGASLQGRSTLHHALPPTTSFVRPTANAQNVGVRGLVLAWKPVAGLDGHIVYLEQDELGVHVTARLPSTASTFAVPEGFLIPGTEYMMGIGTVTKGGNVSYVEAAFRTAPGK
jgi:hypothetical protein